MADSEFEPWSGKFDNMKGVLSSIMTDARTYWGNCTEEKHKINNNENATENTLSYQ